MRFYYIFAYFAILKNIYIYIYFSYIDYNLYHNHIIYYISLYYTNLFDLWGFMVGFAVGDPRHPTPGDQLFLYLFVRGDRKVLVENPSVQTLQLTSSNHGQKV